VSAALAPITILCFGSIPVLGLLFNLVAIPLFGFVLVPAVLFAVVTLPFGELPSGWLLDFASALYARLWPVMSWAADVPTSLVHASPSPIWYAVATIAISAALLPLPWRVRAACLIGLIPASMTTIPAPAVGSLEATVLDVGDRTAIVLRTATHVAYYGDSDVFAGDIVTSYLRHQGLRPETVTSLDAETSAQWDGVSFRALCLQGTFPPSSCVTHITTSHGSLLLTQGLDSAAELEHVRRGLPPADLVIVPRHGANTGSSPQFIAATKARWALLQGNTHRQSAFNRDESRPAVMRWRANSTQVLATADSGAIHVSVDPVTGLLSPVATREISRALWRALP
jgi:competence protein ComEC